MERDEGAGYNLLLECLSKPMQQIAINAGYPGEETVSHVSEANDHACGHDVNGFDASTGLYPADMFTAGIVDPLRVVRSSLNAAASEACLLLLTEVVLGQIPQDTPTHLTGTVGGR
jgi:chaperonin GroEL